MKTYTKEQITEGFRKWNEAFLKDEASFDEITEGCETVQAETLVKYIDN